ncbi:MAG: AzlC family ABC transporter permease [Eubacteriales bacterium]|nr:AzlC family ABC transporter permease [Eubacteriales bacterium]
MKLKKSFLYALRHSLPIFAGFIPLGLAYGVLMQNAGYNALWTGATCIFLLAGSLQFLMISFFTSSVSLITVAVMALLVNSRHIFYGISFIEKFRSFGPWKYYLIYTLSDENYSLHCSAKIEEDMDEKWTFIFTATFILLYWTIPSVLGSLIGSLIPFDMTGVDFALTALFVTILLDQMKGAASRIPAAIAVVSSAICLLIFGPGNFILPSLIITVAALTVLRRYIVPEKEDT